MTSNPDRMGLRYPPMAFTEQGVAMLSGLLHSPRAVQVNIAIMRAFVRLRQVLAQNEDLAKRIEAAEKRLDEHRDTFGDHAQELRALFELLHRLLAPIQGPRPAIGFKLK
ncbi:MAG: hypothetical protein PHF00_11330 [Elusimicrobia bacterium]|nr:hypothetical protein [Elusimicrobiota bacterium]